MRKKMIPFPSLANLCVRCIGEKTQAYEILKELRLTYFPVDTYQDLLMLWSWKALMINHKFVGRWLATTQLPNSRESRSLKIHCGTYTSNWLKIEPEPRQAIMTRVPMICVWLAARG